MKNSEKTIVKVTIQAGTHGNAGNFWVSSKATDEQIATYRLHEKGLELIAHVKNDRERRCSKVFKNIEAMAKFKGWEIVE